MTRRYRLSAAGRAAQSAGGKADGERKRRPPEHYARLARTRADATRARLRAYRELLAAVNHAGALLAQITLTDPVLETERKAVLELLGAAFDAAAPFLPVAFGNGEDT
jgi:hypothetical protein